MIPYQVVYPFYYNITSDNYYNAIKQFSKLHHHMNINNLIITDHNNAMRANLKYFKKHGKNKVGIYTEPYPYNYITNPMMIKSSKNYTPSLDTMILPNRMPTMPIIVPQVVTFHP